MKKIIIPFTYTREFSLMLCQIWGGAYNNFLGVQLETHPRYISFIQRGMASTYRNQELDKEVSLIFLDRVKTNPSYFKNFFDEYANRFNELKNLWEKDYLSREELIYFINELTAFWPAVYSSTYIPNDINFSASDRKLNLKLREKIDIAAHEASNITVKTLQAIYPNLGELVYSISINDFKNSRVKAEKVEKMYNSTLILVEDELVSEADFEDLKKKYNFELEDLNALPNEKHLQGQAAYTGNVRGIVRLIFKRNEMNKIKKGEILVTGMTTPEFLPAMKQAAAFITDEGGLTCHAAIIARELKKPCIIGTKNSTKILKDGDLVEVDANQGIIKILKRV